MERRLKNEHNETERRFQKVCEEFGGVNGTEVTIDQISRYLAADWEAEVAANRVVTLDYEASLLPEPPILERLRNAQDLQRPQGRGAAMEVFSNARGHHEYHLSWNRKMGFIANAKSNERLATACDTAVRVLAA